MQNKNKKLWILLGVLILAIIAVAIMIPNKKSKAPQVANTPSAQTPGAPAAPAPSGTSSAPAVNPALKDATVVVPGANPITKDNVVVTKEGTPVVNNAIPMTPQAPQETAAISASAKAGLATNSKVISLTDAAAGWNPKTFTVSAGAPVTLSITSGDTFTHVFAFNDPSLSAVAVGVGPGETRAITFNAPSKAGSYGYYCNVPGHASRGEVGTMIVK